LFIPEASVEVIPSSPAPKRTRIARSNTAATEVAAPKSAAKKPATRKKKAVTLMSAQDVGGMVATAAYYLAEHRHFTPGHELEDWLEAEKQIKAMLG
jgi:hypothetical protein